MRVCSTPQTPAQREAGRTAVLSAPSRRRSPAFARRVREDCGGNSIDVSLNGRKENLRSLWDTALVELEEGMPA